MTSPDAVYQQLTAELAALKVRAAELERSLRTPKLGHASIERGAIKVFDKNKQERERIGLQPDGTYVGGVSMNGPPPQPPAAPIVEPAIAGLRVTALGPEAGSWPKDFSHINIYLAQGGSDGGLVGKIHQTPAEWVLAPMDYIPCRVWLTAVSKSGAESAPSAEVSGVTPIRVTGDDITDDTIALTHIAAGTIEAGNVAANSITAGMLQAGSITAEKVQANVVIADATMQSGNTGDAQVVISGSGNDIRFYPLGVTSKYARIWSYELGGVYAPSDIAMEMRSIASTAVTEICRFYFNPDQGGFYLAKATDPELPVGGSVSVDRDTTRLEAYTNTGTLAAGYYMHGDGYVRGTGRFRKNNTPAPDSAFWCATFNFGSVGDGYDSYSVSYGATINRFVPVPTPVIDWVETFSFEWNVTNESTTGFRLSWNSLVEFEEDPEGSMTVWAFRV